MFKIIITIVGIIFWIVLLPVTIAHISFTVTKTNYVCPNIWYAITGVVLGLGGLSLSLWAVISHITAGKGTPIPLFGPQKLIVTAPYTFCRNPMTLGLLLYCTGAGIISNNGIAFTLLVTIVIFHMLYDALFEEKELERKFGNDYIAYKQKTPFIFPKMYLKKHR